MIVYKITNSINKKVYIGKTSRSLEWRLCEHIKKAKKRRNTHLYDAMNHYGYENFIIESLEQDISAKDINIREKHWIKVYDSCNRIKGYNMTEGGEGGDTWSLNTHKKETSKKLSFSIKNSSAHKEAMHSSEYRDKLRKLSTGRRFVPRKKIICLTCAKEIEIRETSKQKYCCKRCGAIASGLRSRGKPTSLKGKPSWKKR